MTIACAPCDFNLVAYYITMDLYYSNTYVDGNIC